MGPGKDLPVCPGKGRASLLASEPKQAYHACLKLPPWSSFHGLGGKLVLPMTKEHIMQMLQSPDWKYRHAGLMALSAIGEGCHQQMESILDNWLTGVDQHADSC